MVARLSPTLIVVASGCFVACGCIVGRIPFRIFKKGSMALRRRGMTISIEDDSLSATNEYIVPNELLTEAIGNLTIMS